MLIRLIIIIIIAILQEMAVDLTAQFRKLMPQQMFSAESQHVRLSIQSSLCNKQAEDIISKLKKIEVQLSNNKQNYFSNAAYIYSAFTDKQRNEFDVQIKKLFDETNSKISELKQVVDKTKFNCATQKEHLKSMTVCLYQQYKQVSYIFREFIEFNENRKKKLQSMLGDKNKIKTQFKQSCKQMQKGQGKQKVEVKSADKELERECQMIFIQRMSEQKKIEETMQKIEKINEMLDVMGNKVLEQELITSSFRQIGEVGLFHIEKGNKNLISASNLSKDSGRLWTLFFYILAFSLLFLDWIKS